MFLPVLLVVLLAVALTRSAFAGVIDQKQELDSAVAYGFPGSDQMLGQEFKPSLPILEAVEVKLENTGGGVGGYTFTLTIRDGTISGAILASASQLVDHDFNGWLRFTLTPLYVTPGSTYVMRLQATSAPFAWLYAETLTVGRDPYPTVD